MERAKWLAGPHQLELEPPDIVHCHPRGTVMASEVKEMFTIMREKVIPKVDVYFVVHLKDVGAEAVPIETRKYVGTDEEALACINGWRSASTARS